MLQQSLIKQLAQEAMNDGDSTVLSQFSWNDQKRVGTKEIHKTLEEEGNFLNSIYAIMTKTDNNSTHRDFMQSMNIFVLFLRSFATRNYTSTTANTIKNHLNRNDQGIIHTIIKKVETMQKLYEENVKVVRVKTRKNNLRYEWQDSEKHKEYSTTKESLRSIIKEFGDSEKDFDNLYAMYKDVAVSWQA